ncbi:MAG: hypothetical protein HYT94_05060 [Parcubacteria group bacterium]|nr:hypothetical protein [Parcubacteria group bacterium]
MNEATKSFGEWFKEKTSSPFYFTFIGFVIIWNWKFFYILFWESSELFKAPRIEYVVSNFESSIFAHLTWFLFIPIVSTYIAIVWLPKLNAWAHKIYIKNHFERQRAYDRERLAYEREKTENLRNEVKEKTIQKELKYEVEKDLTQEEKWDLESKDLFSIDENISALRKANDAIYKTGGKFATEIANLNQSYATYIPPTLLSRLDTLSLASIRNRSTNYGEISFTPKGKYFVLKLQNLKKI